MIAGIIKFKRIEITVNPEIFKKAVQKTTIELRWEITLTTNKMVVAKGPFSWASWGELITIIREKDAILINSICDPDNRPSVTSFGQNKINKKTFEQQLGKLSGSL